MHLAYLHTPFFRNSRLAGHATQLFEKAFFIHWELQEFFKEILIIAK